jgi:hypothetical protein
VNKNILVPLILIKHLTFKEEKMKIIKARTHSYSVSYMSTFEFEDSAIKGAGFAFECDEDGRVELSTLTLAGRKNFNSCMEGFIESIDSESLMIVRKKILFKGVETRNYSQHEPAVGLCDVCGAKVELSGFTNTCGCGADYNMSGQLLADRSQWGEETGETVSDILSVDGYSTDELLD